MGPWGGAGLAMAPGANKTEWRHSAGGRDRRAGPAHYLASGFEPHYAQMTEMREEPYGHARLHRSFTGSGNPFALPCGAGRAPDCRLSVLTDLTRAVAVLPAMRPAPHGGEMSKRLATLLVALALSGCATAPPPPAYVAKTLVPSCDGSTKECDRKNTPAPRRTKCTGFLDLRVLYGTCSE